MGQYHKVSCVLPAEARDTDSVGESASFVPIVGGNIWKYFRSHIAGLLFSGIIVSAAQLFTPFLSGYILKNIPEMASYQFVLIFIASLFAMVSVCLLSLINELKIRSLGAHMIFHQMSSLWEKILYLPAEITLKWVSGDLAQRLIVHENTMASVVPLGVTLLLQVVSAVFFVILMACYSFSLTVFYIAVLVFFFVLKVCVMPANVRHITEEITGQRALAAHLNESLLQIQKIHSANALHAVHKKWFAKLAEVRIHRACSVKIEIFVSALDSMVPAVLSLILYVYAGFAVETATLLSFMITAGQFSVLVGRLTASVVSLMHCQPGLKQMQSVAEIQPAFSRRLLVPPFRQSLVLSKISYKTPGGNLCLRNINLTVRAGEFIGIMGKSGAGKSTLLRLILGLIMPDEGCVMMDGSNICHFDPGQFRARFGVVLQNTCLFPGTIFSNIASNTRINPGDAWKLAEFVGLSDDLAVMPMKLFTHVSDNPGESISGGQRQKILIARALATSPEIMLLDEATSALDNISQMTIHRRLRAFNITRIVVAHRLSTLAGADRIYYMGDQGLQLMK